jgi:hypothetical protein
MGMRAMAGGCPMGLSTVILPSFAWDRPNNEGIKKNATSKMQIFVFKAFLLFRRRATLYRIFHLTLINIGKRVPD